MSLGGSLVLLKVERKGQGLLALISLKGRC
jgi:hypothetical protein